MNNYDKSTTSYAIGFKIGYDIYRYRYYLDDKEVDIQSIKHGFDAARIQNVSRIKPDKFVKKLLQIRRRAFRKKIPVNINIENLKEALSLTKGICPVLGRTLTYNTGKDTDWSVDRLDNDLGYTPDNIFIMSSEANKAKNSISLQDLLLYIFDLGNDILISEPKLGLYDKTFWVKLYFAIYKRMPSDMFCNIAHDFFLNPKHQQMVRDQILMELVMLAMNENAILLPIKQFKVEIQQSELLKPVIPFDFFSRVELLKIRRSAIQVTTSMNVTDITLDAHTFQDKVCSKFISKKRTVRYVQAIEALVNEATSKPTICGILLGVMTKRVTESNIVEPLMYELLG